jgi:hypothetical protein
MNVQILLKKRAMLAVVVVMLLLVLVACNPFGRNKTPAATATVPPPPTETPFPVLPTYTPTPVPPTATPVSEEGAQEAQPTLTPTTQPAEAAVGGEEGVEEGVPIAAPAKLMVQVTTVPEIDNVVQNGSFEEGFSEQGVAQGWTAFSNGDAGFAWADELQAVNVSHDAHAQLMQIHDPAKPDRFIGIYQTVDVVPGETYTLALHGLIRSSTAGDPKIPYGHRIQWAIDDEGKSNWWEMNGDWGQWTDPGWNDVALDAKNPAMNVYVQQVTPENAKLTLYVRGWTKWPIMASQAQFYLDGISLEGPVPGTGETRLVSTGGGDGEVGEGMPTTGGRGVWIPVAGLVLVLGFAVWEVRKVRVP